MVTADLRLEAVMRVSDRMKVRLPKVDILFPNQAEAECLTGRRDIGGAIESLLDYAVGSEDREFLALLAALAS